MNLADINAATNSKDGDIYSDLYKDVYGFRPRYATFESLAAFDADYEYLVNKLSEQLAEENIEKAARFAEFLDRIDTIQQVVVGCDRARAVNLLADAEGIEADELKFYGFEVLEYRLGLRYGSVKEYLATVDA